MASKAKASASAARLVQDLVRAGGEVPDAAALGAVKRYARQSDAHVAEVFEAVWEQLGDKHSQARYLALQLCAELWPRSAAFRHALVARIAPDFVRLVAGELAGGAELPPPPQWAERTRRCGVELLRSWHRSHGELDGYRPLALALRHLRQAATAPGAPVEAAQLAVADATASTLPAQRRQRWRDKYAEMQEAAPERLGEARRCIAQLREALRLLAPALDEDDEDDEDGEDGGGGDEPSGEATATAAADADGAAADDDADGDDDADDDGDDASEAAAWGGSTLLWGGGGALELDLSASGGRHGEEQAALVDALRDASAEARNAFVPELRGWLRTLARVELPAGERAAHTALLSRVAETHAAIRAALRRAAPLLAAAGDERDDTDGAAALPATRANPHAFTELPSAAAAAAGDDDDDDDDDDHDDDEFESVHKPGYEHLQDPDAGWERPPPEALRHPDDPPAAAAAAAPAMAPVARLAAPPPPPTYGEPCGAPRRDGSRCVRLVPPGEACYFHGYPRWGAAAAAAPPAAAAAAVAPPVRLEVEAAAAAPDDDDAAAPRKKRRAPSQLEPLRPQPTARERLKVRVEQKQRRGGAKAAAAAAAEADASYKSRHANDLTVAWSGMPGAG